MDFELSEQQKMFQQAVRDFVNSDIAPLVKESEQNEHYPTELFLKMGKLGYLCPSYPEEYGAGALGEVGDCILVGELARVCAGICAGIMVQGGLATHAILAHGTQQQKQRYLVPAIRGEKIAAYGLTEPNAGSDAAAIETTAVKDGDHYVINGSKIYITNGQICDFVTLAACTDRSKGSRGISTIIVEKGTRGFTATKMRKLGMHSADTAELAFEDCHVPAENLVGEEGSGYKYMLEALNRGRISHAARSLGIAEAAFEVSLDYARQREQFGQPIGRFQAIAFKLSSLATQIEAARSFLYRVAWLYDQGSECRKEGPMVKFFCSELAIKAAEEAMRIHAGAGYLAESVVQRYFRDAILGHTTEGTTEIQQLVIARELRL
jgi:alkylation response protein AidB-like acyl-CoA dehydrogenase